MQSDYPADQRADSYIQEKLAREILRNEILRATILFFVFPGLGTLLSVVPLLVPDHFQRLTGGRVPIWLPALAFGPVCLFFFLLRVRLYQFAARRRVVPKYAQYINAFVETSIPTAAILLVSVLREPAAVSLHLPPVYIYFLFIILSGLRLSRNLCIFTGCVAAAGYLLAAGVIRQNAGQELDIGLDNWFLHGNRAIIYVLSGVLTGWVTERNKQNLLTGFRALEQRNHITAVFGQHVSPEVMDELVQTGAEVPSRLREVCVIFFDIRDFTTYSESRGPEEVVEFLNEIFSICIEKINSNHGIINKFLGDGFMAVFGAPLSSGTDAANALAAALEIHRQIAESFPDIQFGMGLHAGFAVTGNVGSAVRKEYTIIGDVVNVASRIEQLTKQYESRILVSRELLDRIENHETRQQHDAQDLGPVTVKGRAGETHIFRIA